MLTSFTYSISRVLIIAFLFLLTVIFTRKLFAQYQYNQFQLLQQLQQPQQLYYRHFHPLHHQTDFATICVQYHIIRQSRSP